MTVLFTVPTFAAKKHTTPQVNHDQEIRTRDYMIEVSRQLGVTCNYCHDVKNFRQRDMKAWKTGKEHMRIVELLNTRGFTHGPKADCYLCHRGKAVPDYRETAVKTDSLTPPPPASPEAH
jgi:hypothetical protein